jgi:nucleoside-diphosphate-sugar epimerase
MRVLVTGSAGFIGRSLCKKLLEEGCEVYGLDMVETPIKHKFFKSLVGDITDSRYIDPDYGASEWWKEIDFVFHLAAMANVDEVREKRYKAFQVNLLGTFYIVEACRKNNIPMALASTACCYGNTKQHPSTEDGPTNPVDWYGVTKRAGEELVKGLLKHWLILRFGTTYGPEMRPELCTHIFLKQAIKKERFTIRGNGEQTRNWVYIDDLVDGCIKAMKYNLTFKENHIFNLTGTKTYSVRDLATVCNCLVNGNNVFSDDLAFLPERPDDVFIEDISNEKAKSLLGWSPNTSLYDGMKLIYEEWKKNGT